MPILWGASSYLPSDSSPLPELCVQAQYAISSMGLPVLLSVLSEDRDDLELLKGALEVLQLSVALPEGMQQQEQSEVGGTPQEHGLSWGVAATLSPTECEQKPCSR